VRRIAEDLSINKSTVFRAFNELEEQGLLKRFPRYHTQGGRRSSLYKIKGEITPVKNRDDNVISEKGGGINV
jgi:iclR helix-turn-helix domain